jgi:hypothetical protein
LNQPITPLASNLTGPEPNSSSSGFRIWTEKSPEGDVNRFTTPGGELKVSCNETTDALILTIDDQPVRSNATCDGLLQAYILNWKPNSAGGGTLNIYADSFVSAMAGLRKDFTLKFQSDGSFSTKQSRIYDNRENIKICGVDVKC